MMKSNINTLIAFILNLSFAIIEFIYGGIFNSSAILADAVHDTGDAVAIGIAAFLENFSNRKEDHQFSLGYKRFSLLGAIITALILIIGSFFVTLKNIPKLIHPEPVNYNGMLILGIIAIIINFIASYVVSRGQTKNEAILSLHFLEDILGWLAIIAVSIILRFTNWYFLDPLLSLMISIFILSRALPQFWTNLKIFLGAVPEDICLKTLENEIAQHDNIRSINQINLWSMDGLENNATLHICVDDTQLIEETKHDIRDLLEHHQVYNVTIEIDSSCEAHDLHKRDIEKIFANRKGHTHSHGHHHHH